MKSTGNSAAFRRAGQLYRQQLQTSSADPAWAPLAIEALRAPLRVLKSTPTQRVLIGAAPAAAGIVFKYYADRGLFSRWRPSRARRAWAAARAAQSLGAPVVDALGFVERERELAPFSSCLIMRQIEGGITLREWIRKNHRTLDAAQWDTWKSLVLRLWLVLNQCGFYHDDTKALNVLLTFERDAPRPVWIDPESLRPGHRPSPREVIRNLVQLNGSLRSWVPDEVRLQFLREAAAHFPALDRPDVERRIREWTRRRLLHERDSRCGP